MIGYHGFIGQHIRGEVTVFTLEGFTSWIQDHYEDLSAVLNKVSDNEINGNVPDIITRWFVLLNLIDTASVHEGLYTERLHNEFLAFGEKMAAVLTPNDEGHFETTWNDILREEITSFQKEGETFEIAKKKYFADRIKRLRAERVSQNPSSEGEKVDNAVFYLPQNIFDTFFELSLHGQQWYTENATSYLSVDNQLKILFLAHRTAEVAGINTSQNYNLNFLELMNDIKPENQQDKARQKVVDTFLRNMSWDDLMKDEFIAELLKGQEAGVTTIKERIGSEHSVGINFPFEKDAKAACEAINEIFDHKRDNTDFQELLRILQDVYGLTIDQWDRGLYEQEYMEHMDSSMEDKRMSMLIHVPHTDNPRIVDLGAGTGKLSALAAKEFPDSTITAVDISQSMISDIVDEAKQLAHQKTQGAPVGEVIAMQGSAIELSQLVAENSQDAVFASSFIHEIGSFVDNYEFGSQTRQMFSEIFKVLRPGGRLIIRDFVQPEDPDEVLTMEIGEIKDQGEVDPLHFMEQFVSEYKGGGMEYLREQIHQHKKAGTWREGALLQVKASDGLVEIAAHYSWARSFDKEKEERYSYFPLDGYISYIQQIAGEEGHATEVVTAHSYLQPGYPEHVLGRLNFYRANENGAMEVVGLSPFTGVIVIEKK